MYIKGNATWKCKITMSSSPRMENAIWKQDFIKDKWYDVEYEIHSNPETARINGGYRKIWVVNESGKRVEFGSTHIRIMFHNEYNKTDMRESQIDNILNDDGHSENT
jgi:hypothetical protein